MTVQRRCPEMAIFTAFFVDTCRDISLHSKKSSAEDTEDTEADFLSPRRPRWMLEGPWNRMQRFLINRPGPTPAASPGHTAITEFYREEFMKHHRCLQRQREYFSSQAIDSVESALVRVISQVDALSTTADADQVVAKLLKEFDVVTRLSAWSDPHKAH